MIVKSAHVYETERGYVLSELAAEDGSGLVRGGQLAAAGGLGQATRLPRPWPRACGGTR
jgi:hypothetical protein